MLYTINLPAEGSRLVGGSIQCELSSAAIDATLMEGFFPHVPLDANPVSGQSGFQEFGLPYAADAAITRHLASFLNQHRRTGIEDGDTSAADRPDLVLFNGGVLSSTIVQDRIIDSVSRWFSDSESEAGDSWKPEVLISPRLDLAVAHGAAYYAMVRRGQGVRIAANLGRSYYIQVQTEPPRGLCLIPANAEAGQSFRTDNHPLRLQIGAPAQFPLWVSSTRLADPVGEVIPMDRRELSPLPPICTALMSGKRKRNEAIDVVIESELSEIGTVGLFCHHPDSNERWKLQFDIRSTLQTDRQAHTAVGESSGIVDAETIERCGQCIRNVFDGSTDPSIKPSQLIKRLQSTTGSSRRDWPPSLLRELWQALIEAESGRRQSPQHESRWLNLAGYCLRPGYGVAVDDWRVEKTWRTIHGKLAFSDAASRYESMILWRRISGGLTAGQQQQLAGPLSSVLKNKSRRIEPNEAAEVWRLLGSMERLKPGDKIDLANLAVAAMKPKKNQKLRPALLWALGRMASRQLTYGPLNCTIPASTVAKWTEEIRRLDEAGHFVDCENSLMLAMVQLSRHTGDRFRDLPGEEIERTIATLRSHRSPEHFLTLLTKGGAFEGDEETAIFGESLPLGIRLVR